MEDDEPVQPAAKPGDEPVGSRVALANARVNELIRSGTGPRSEAPTAAAPGSPPAAAAETDPAKPKEPEPEPRVEKQPLKLRSVAADEPTPEPAKAEDEPEPEPAAAAPAEPTPAKEAWDKFVKDRFDGDEDAAKAAVYQTDTRAAESAKLLKEANEEIARLKGEKPAPPEPTPDEAMDGHLRNFAKTDPGYKAIAERWIADTAEMQKIIQTNDKKQIVGGDLIKVRKDIEYYQRKLESEKETLNEMEVLDLKGILTALELKDERLAGKHERLYGRTEELARNCAKVLETERQRILRTADSKREESVEEERKAKAETQTDATLKAHFKALGKEFSAEDANDLEGLLLARIVEHHEVHGKDIEDLPAWLKAETDKIAAKWKRSKAKESVEAARVKDRDNRQPAPKGAAATAEPRPPTASELSPRERRLQAAARTQRLAQKIVAGA